MRIRRLRPDLTHLTDELDCAVSKVFQNLSLKATLEILNFGKRLRWLYPYCPPASANRPSISHYLPALTPKRNIFFKKNLVLFRVNARWVGASGFQLA
jgi:hypothetical protein